MECAGPEGVARYNLRRPGFGKHDPPMRWPREHDVVLDLLRCFRRGWSDPQTLCGNVRFTRRGRNQQAELLRVRTPAPARRSTHAERIEESDCHKEGRRWAGDCSVESG